MSVIMKLIFVKVMQQFYLSDPRGDGYVPPRGIEQLITKVQESTVTIFCEPNDPKILSSFGSAWAIDLEHNQGKRYPTTLITNHHVIDECFVDYSISARRWIVSGEIPVAQVTRTSIMQIFNSLVNHFNRKFNFFRRY